MSCNPNSLVTPRHNLEIAASFIDLNLFKDWGKVQKKWQFLPWKTPYFRGGQKRRGLGWHELKFGTKLKDAIEFAATNSLSSTLNLWAFVTHQPNLRIKHHRTRLTQYGLSRNRGEAYHVRFSSKLFPEQLRFAMSGHVPTLILSNIFVLPTRQSIKWEEIPIHYRHFLTCLHL